MKAVWEKGRKELFYPHEKTYVQKIAEQE